MAVCMRCGRQLQPNEIGATKKFINRGATSYFCFSCLAEELEVTEELIQKKIEQFKKQGCTLFI